METATAAEAPTCGIVASLSEAAIKQEVPSCEICFDGFNKSTRKQVTCSYCSHNFCRGCVEQYVLSQGEQIVCPETTCRMPWLEDFVDDQFTAVFRGGTLRKHREKFVLDREKARLPELQDRARRYKIALEGKEGKSAITAAAKAEYLKEPIPAELARLKAERDAAYEPSRKIEARRNKITEYRYIPRNGEVSAHYKTIAKPGYEEEVKELNKQLEETGKNITATWEAYRKYERANKEELDRLYKKYLTPAKQQNKCPEFRRMVDMYGAPLRIWVHTKAAVDALKKRLVELYGEGSYIEPAAGAVIAETRRVVEVMRGCPAEGCRGFLNNKWTCGVCDTAVCRHCHEVVDVEVVAVPGHSWLNAEGPGVRVPEEEAPEGRTWHRCDPAAYETARLLARETKPCPSCKALISKIDGCDQMWCTQCQTAFSWSTGEKEEGRVHNPHYYEWLRRTQGAVPREPARPGDVGFAGDCCAEENRLMELPWYDADVVDTAAGLANYFMDVMKIRQGVEGVQLFEVEEGDDDAVWEGEHASVVKKAVASLLSAIHRRVLEVYQYDVANRRNWYERHIDEKGTEDAIDFLVGRLTEEDWLKRSWGRDRMRRYHNDVKEVKRMFYAAGRDLLNSFTLGHGSVKAGETIRGFVELFNYANAAIIKARKRYCLTSYQEMTISPASLATYQKPAPEIFETFMGERINHNEYNAESLKKLNTLVYGFAGAKLPNGMF